MTYTIRSAYGWTFVLNGTQSTGHYRTRTVARERLAYHKANRTAYYFPVK